MSKASYINCPNKRAVQQEIYSNNRVRNLIGLAGPNPATYIETILNCHIKSAILLESNKKALDGLNGVTVVRKRGRTDIRIAIGDILDVEYDPKKWFYDLDFCLPIHEYLLYIVKFKD